MADWIIVVDDEMSNLKIAGSILSGAGMRVTAFKSGEAFLDYASKNDAPDLVLMDVKMPVMDGFETLQKLRQIEGPAGQAPVVFLTADENEESEKKGLSLGAMDFIKKPFVPDVLTIRIRHLIDLNHLQKHLADEVKKKTEENERMFLNVVRSLADAIDAKDRYTSGHSQRVADYAAMIAREMGKSEEDVKMVYYAGLLHDVGKIRVPGSVINKPGRLSEDEYNLMKIHPVSGFHILNDIHDDARIVYGAKYHHERYDGKGYPNGLEGECIPEISRIIAVADAYDAMTSDRSYRKAIPQDVVRSEIERGRGVQFDPKVADIMLKIIDEDSDYSLRQKKGGTQGVLVVDDDPLLVMNVRKILGDMDEVSVYEAATAAEALEELDKEDIDLVMLDLKMPDMDGFVLFEEMKKKHDVPVLLMTGDRNEETIKKIEELGIDDYLTKPLHDAVTCEAVHGILNRHRKL